jgi:hypothetical protein
MGHYAADGSWNVTVVDGTVNTGYYADDGSVNVVDASAETDNTGLSHPCGATWVTRAPADTLVNRQADNGSLYVSTTGNPKEAQRITILSGVLP